MMNKLIKAGMGLMLAAVMALAVPSESYAAPGLGSGAVFPNRYNEYASTYVSTQTTYLNGLYFTVDCYHDRVIYAEPENVGTDTSHWKIMADDLNKPHSICSDGVIYLVTDTDNNRVVTYTRLVTGEFIELQSFENVGIRPHYCVYDQASASFYVWSSYTGEMFIYKRPANGFALRLDKVKRLDYLYGVYTRSFTIDGNNILLCSQGAGGIISVNKRTFALTGVYPVCDDLGGVVQVAHIGSHYYLTTSSDRFGNQSRATVVRSTSLGGFYYPGQYEDVNELLGGLRGSAAPYYLTPAAGVYFARFMGTGGGYNDFAVTFAEDPFGNIILGTRFP
ncbi:MAG: hypothetical protein J6V94_08380 [Lachnospiraceae bacterium]|nr:hypothetical protein [Lachnospiraceae bacterium]